MRSFLYLVFPALFAGCGPSSDPNLDPDCSKRGTREVVVGTGEEEFVPIGPNQGVSQVFGSQGGSHIWIALRTRQLGPHVTLEYGIRDVETGFDWSGPLRSVAELEYNDDAMANEVFGIFGYLPNFCDVCPANGNPVGRRVVIWAEVDDQCKVPTRGEIETVIQ